MKAFVRKTYVRAVLLFFSVSSTITASEAKQEQTAPSANSRVKYEEDSGALLKTTKRQYKNNAQAIRSLSWMLFENDDKYNDHMKENRLCDIGDGYVYSDGEALITFETRCGSLDAFPCYCAPDLDPPIVCPYCGFHSRQISGATRNANLGRKEDSKSDHFFCLKDGETSDPFLDEMEDAKLVMQQCSCSMNGYEPISTCTPLKRSRERPKLVSDPKRNNNANDKESPDGTTKIEKQSTTPATNKENTSPAQSLTEMKKDSKPRVVTVYTKEMLEEKDETSRNENPAPVDNKPIGNNPYSSREIAKESIMYNNENSSWEVVPTNNPDVSQEVIEESIANNNGSPSIVENSVNENTSTTTEGVQDDTTANNDGSPSSIATSTKNTTNVVTETIANTEGSQSSVINTKNTTNSTTLVNSNTTQAETATNDKNITSGTNATIANDDDKTPSARSAPIRKSAGDICTLELESGETKIFQRGESYGNYLPTRCKQSSKFPCKCNPDLYGQVECPYCGFRNNEGDLICAAHEQIVSFLIPGTRNVESCTCWVPSNPRQNPYDMCSITDYNNQNPSEKNVGDDGNDGAGIFTYSAAGTGSATNGEIYVRNDSSKNGCGIKNPITGEDVTIPNGRSFSDYLEVEGICGNGVEWPAYCSADAFDTAIIHLHKTHHQNLQHSNNIMSRSAMYVSHRQDVIYPYCIFADTISGTPVCAKDLGKALYTDKEGERLECSCKYEGGEEISTCLPYELPTRPDVDNLRGDGGTQRSSSNGEDISRAVPNYPTYAPVVTPTVAPVPSQSPEYLIRVFEEEVATSSAANVNLEGRYSIIYSLLLKPAALWIVGQLFTLIL